MDMHHGLSCGLPDVDPEIVAVGRKFLSQIVLRLLNEIEQSGLLSLGGIEKIGNMPVGNDEKMPRVDRIFVAPDMGQFVPEQDPFLPAERAALHNLSLIRLTVSMPSAVMEKEPKRCTPASTLPHKYSDLEKSVTTSAEKVEKVVSPPRKPVTAKSLASGGREEWGKKATATPTR